MILKKIAVIGGDARFAVCAELFAKKGCECAVFGLEKAENLSVATKSATLSDALKSCDAVILPLPVSKNGDDIYTPLSDMRITLTDFSDNIDGNPVVFTGQELCNSEIYRFDTVCYTSLKTFALLGSVPTAECAVALAIYHSKKSCCNSRCLIIGCGNIGKYLSLLTRNIGAEIFVSARKNEDFAWIEAHGMTALKTYDLSSADTEFDVIYNTVPHKVLDANALESLKGSPLIIELASKPYGADFKYKKIKAVKTAFIFYLIIFICFQDSVLHQQ